jgi:hypothetical protein
MLFIIIFFSAVATSKGFKNIYTMARLICFSQIMYNIEMRKGEDILAEEILTNNNTHKPLVSGPNPLVASFL